jgi:hypothetical protein
MIVLRVQDAEGRGPYRPGFSSRWVDRHGAISAVPLWWEEIGESMAAAHARMTGPYHFGCGFKAYAQFESWFSATERRRLERLGFHLVTVSADRVIADTPTQIVFGSILPLTSYLRKFRLSSDAARAA